MVFEPVTILTTATAFLGFLVGTVERTIDAADNASRCREYLLVHHFHLNDLLQGLKKWYERWHKDARPRTRTELWGAAGERDVEARLSLIQNEALSLKRCLYEGIRNSKAVDLALEDLLEHQDDEQRAFTALKLPEGPRERHVLGSFTYALYQKKLLSDSLKRLQELISWLDNASNRLHHERHGTDDKNLHEMIKLLSHLSGLKHAMRLAYSWTKDQRGIWALIVSPCEHFIEDANPDEIPIPFFYQSLTTTEGRRLDVVYHPGRRNTAEISEELKRVFARPVAEQERRKIDKTLHHDFRLSQGFNAVRRRKREKVTRAFRANIALSVASWIALIWDTPWVEEICCCKILHILLDGHGLGRREPAVASDHLSTQIACSLSELKQRPYLLLFVLLSEIALAQPLWISSSSDEYIFRLNNGASPDRMPAISEQSVDTNPSQSGIDYLEVLERVEAKMSRKYRQAVAHCYEQDFDRRRRCLSTSETMELNSADFQLYKEKVLKKLKQDYDMVEQHQEDKVSRVLYLDLARELANEDQQSFYAESNY